MLTTGKIIITIELPQPVRKIAPFLTAMDKPWPGTTMVAHRRTFEFDDELDDGRYTIERYNDGDMIQVADNSIGGMITIPRRQLAAFITALNGVGEGPILLNVDGASTIDVPAS